MFDIKKILTNNGHCIRSIWNLLGHDDEEHREGHEYGDTEGDFLSALSRKQKDHKKNEGEHHAGQQDVHEVECVLPAQPDAEVHFWKCFRLVVPENCKNRLVIRHMRYSHMLGQLCVSA